MPAWVCEVLQSDYPEGVGVVQGHSVRNIYCMHICTHCIYIFKLSRSISSLLIIKRWQYGDHTVKEHAGIV